MTDAASAAPRVAQTQEQSDRFQRRFVTPEGVDLRLQLASFGERAGALIIDLSIMAASLVVLTILVVVVGSTMEGAGNTVTIIWLAGFFFLRAFYFVFFEMGSRAATPGKRMVGIRVASRKGGALRAESIFARNAMREVELFLPAAFILGGAEGGVDGWIILIGALWSLIFALLPLMNKDRLRPGDLIAGTWVVKTPKLELAADMAATKAPRAEGLSFSDQELDVYGEHELKVLEDVLRAKQPETMKSVAERICTKIGRPGENIDTEAFLSAYYAALRQRLESRLLLGKRRRDKFDKS